ncbi:kinase-like domain-containing protein [Amanita rubescens]|nr:kinase-like domain-containing protein [Amanita rubescens]
MTVDENVQTIRELLSREDYVDAVADINNTSDARDLLDSLLGLLCNGRLSNSGIQSEASRARRLVLKIATKTPVTPRSLFLTGVTVQDNFDYNGYGGFGVVIKGELGGTVVALKLLYKNFLFESQNAACGLRIKQEFCREALTWKSLNHKFVLPLLGIHEAPSSQLFLFSPYMKNGTLAQWRKKANPSTGEIEERVLEVAQGLQYIHSEGIVHGDLRGDNILLDVHFHVQISDFGLTRHLESTLTKSGALFHNFAAPELFGKWDMEGDDLDDGQSMARTQKSDIYAFGCLYYEIHYGTIPFGGVSEIQIIMFVSRGGRPPRLEVPSLSAEAWKLMQDCWAKEKSTRPAIEDVVERMMAWQNEKSTRPAIEDVVERMTACQMSRLALTQPSGVKNEKAFPNGTPDFTLLILTYFLLMQLQLTFELSPGYLAVLWSLPLFYI